MNWILHHYDFSNFSEVVRLILGLKQATWDSVEIPSHLPKPDYTPLTGGYRRTPALQIGADVYCDTRLIADVIEERVVAPSLYPGSAADKVIARSIADWADSRLLWPAALYITGINADRYALDFHLDRALLHGKPPPEVARVKASAPKYLGQLRSELNGIEELLADGRSFVLGDTPGMADFTLYKVPWFLDVIEPAHGLLDNMPMTRDWMRRISSIGHGTRLRLDAASAIARANQATPEEIDTSCFQSPEGYQIGDRVTVSPLDENSPATGILAYVDDRRITIAVGGDRVDRVHVHFPRSGYKLSRA